MSVRSFVGETLDLEVRAEETANNEYPLAMDVVYVYDDELLAKVLAMTAREWFDQRQTLMNTVDEGTLDTWSWEWTPGHDTTVAIPLSGSVVGAVVFVNYFSVGQHRARIDPARDARIDLGFDRFTVAPL
jgi:type VI secretion system protein